MYVKYTIVVVMLLTTMVVASTIKWKDAVLIDGSKFNRNTSNLIGFIPNPSNNYSGLRWYDSKGDTQAILVCHELANEKQGSRAVHNHCSWYTSMSDGIGRQGRINIQSHTDIAEIRIQDAVLVIGSDNSKIVIKDDKGKYQEIYIMDNKLTFRPYKKEI